MENSDSYVSDHLQDGTPGQKFVYKAELQKAYIENDRLTPADKLFAEQEAMRSGTRLDINPALDESDLIDSSPIKQANLVGNYIENNEITLTDVHNADGQALMHDTSDLNLMEDPLSAGEEFIRDVNLTESYLDNGEVTSVDEINAENTAFAEGGTLDYLF